MVSDEKTHEKTDGHTFDSYRAAVVTLELARDAPAAAARDWPADKPYACTEQLQLVSGLTAIFSAHGLLCRVHWDSLSTLKFRFRWEALFSSAATGTRPSGQVQVDF